MDIASNTLVVAQVEDDINIIKQIMKQTVKPADYLIMVDQDPASGINDRRTKIAHNHKLLKRSVKKTNYDYVWQLEGDVVLEPDAFEKLIKTYEAIDDSKKAIVSGVQLGRHGITAVGAWNFNEERTVFESLDYQAEGIQQVDATGFYCMLMDRRTWLDGVCSWSGERYGPDVNFGLNLIDKGYNNYVNADIKVGHLVSAKGGERIIDWSNKSICNVRFEKHNNVWGYHTWYN